MKTQEVDAQDGIVVVLENDFNALNEVVVTAMGITREKKALGYAIQEVKSDELMAAGAPSVTSALNGKIAGVQINTFGGSVGASSRISVRGNSSLSGDQQPLIVVDGVPINNDTQRTGDNTYRGVDFGSGLNDINPEDIESISVLKGGSAALYGMRAGNGVILITTKTGKRSGGIEVSYDGSVTFDRVANIPKLQNSYGQGYDGDGLHYKWYQEDGGTLDRQAYLAGKGAWDGTEDRLFYEEWVAFFKEVNEAWAFYRRTGYPKYIQTAVYSAESAEIYSASGCKAGERQYLGDRADAYWGEGTHTDVPFRMPYPSNQFTYNKANVEAASAGIVDYCWGKQLWWDKRTGVK